MKVTYNWLKEYADFDWDPDELVERLTMAGLEREGVEHLGERLAGILVGAVLSRQQHPNADRLSVCSVDVGGEAPQTIVCGAPNVDAGQKVAVVLPGSRLPDGTVIRKAKLRGVESSGMICSETELGLGEDADGILVLDPDLKPGTPLAQAIGFDDVLLDFEVTPNRPDCLSMVGIAREITAQTGGPLRLPAVDLAPSGPPTAAAAAVRIEAPEQCPRYVARIIRGVRVGPSPAWLQNRLKAVGQRPINNVVDVTNFVMLELGQPLHAFDLAKLEGGQIVVRRAGPDETLQTLDGTERPLQSDDLVIADARRPVALAGVMGGANSEVDAQTTDLLLESAYFEAAGVRRTRSRLGLHTEASMRFERGADWDMPPLAADRAAALIAAIAGGQVAPEAIDAYPAPRQRRHLQLRPGRASALLGVQLDAGTCSQLLQRLGCAVDGTAEPLAVEAPSFRPDLEREIDLVEEVGRVYGFNRIAARFDLRGPVATRADATPNLQRRTRQRLAGLGLDEVSTNPVVTNRWLELAGATTDSAPKLVNPPSEAQAWMRAGLGPGLLEVARYNFNRRARSVAVFELGKCFGPDGEGLRLAALMSGSATDALWRADRRDFDLLDLKGVLEALLQGLNVDFDAAEGPLLRPGHGARILLDGQELGRWGQVRPGLAAEFDLERPVYIFELDFGLLAACWADRTAAFVPLPKFPPIERDLALIVGEDVPAGQVVASIKGAEPRLLEAVELFDVYRGDQVEAGHKSLAVSVRLRADDRTLEDAQADAAVERILKRLKTDLNARLR